MKLILSKIIFYLFGLITAGIVLGFSLITIISCLSFAKFVTENLYSLFF